MIQLQIRNYSEEDRKQLKEALARAYNHFVCPNNCTCKECPNKKPCMDILQAINFLDN